MGPFPNPVTCLYRHVSTAERDPAGVAVLLGVPAKPINFLTREVYFRPWGRNNFWERLPRGFAWFCEAKPGKTQPARLRGA